MTRCVRFARAGGWLLALVLAVACAPAAPPPAASSPSAPAAPAAPAQAAPTAAGPTPSGKPVGAVREPALPTAPVVDLKVGILPLASYGPFIIARDRGYFREVGLDVELIPTASVNEQMPALAQGQLQVAGCSSSAGCLNALHRRTDMAIVADIQSAGKTEKSTGPAALVVRKDLWDDGTIRQARDLVGRTIHVVIGPGSASHAQAVLWLRRHGVDPQSVEVAAMPFADQLAAMQNRAIEVSIQAEPLLSAGVARGVHQILATQEDMYPTAQTLFVMYWTGIERMGPMVGERFMVAYLRGVRDYINAFEYGVDQDPIVDMLVKDTIIKDPAVYRQIKYAWVDPNGVVGRASLEADAELFRELGVIGHPIDLSQAFDDKYRQFAVQYLGEYRPPQ